ncbi:MAG: hypothetical protein GEU88_12750 [Solirubrobacterales bacterium]|nr:hypothetical protein [Solirubrobacterales bacterium]
MSSAGERARWRAPAAALAVATIAILAAPGPARGAGAGPPSGEGIELRAAAPQGSGAFGRWRIDRFGLPAYEYGLDERVDPRAAQPEIGGETANWSQVGNDAIVANAFNHGYTQLFSQARLYQWTNRYDPDSRHYAGGYGYLRLADGRTASTLYLDQPPGADLRREFGVGYARKRMRFGGISVSETTTAPFGDQPALVDEVRIRNLSRKPRRLTWWEYWDVNPVDATTDTNRGLGVPGYSAARRTLSVDQAPNALDGDPLSIFLAAVDTRVAGYEADTEAFFGAGDRALPAAVAADRASGATAPASVEATPGRAMFATRTPLALRPGRAVTLRFVYGVAHRDRIERVVDAASRGESTWADSSRSWASWVPRADLGRRLAWLARELAWDAYMVRSSSVYEETCGHHVITQGGYYQYGLGRQIAFRDPLQHMLPMVYADPELAREVLRYSFEQQTADTGAIAYGVDPMCVPAQLGTSNDMDFWLLLSLSEYVLATRDREFLDQRLAYRAGPAGAGSGTVWDHVKLAVRHQETAFAPGPSGNYLMGTEGDWSDFATSFLPATESVLVTAQLAYAYPVLAEVAELRGDDAFAAHLRALGRRNLERTRAEWTGRGWYARGYLGSEQVGRGAIYLEPQPWAMLAGAPDAERSAALVANIERYLQGRGAPPQLGGPTRIGTSQSPARNDPDVTETDVTGGVGDNNALFVGGAWYSLNGPLAWALGELDGTVPGAARKAFDELRRNTLHAHAEAFPEHWIGILHVDDACNSFYATHPDRCGIELLLDLGETNGQITHQPAWSLFAILRLAGIEPGRRGYEFAPSLPRKRFALHLPRVGIEVEPGRMRGYVRTESASRLRLRLDPPTEGRLRRVRVRLDGRPVERPTRRGGAVTVEARPGADRLVEWALRYR